MNLLKYAGVDGVGCSASASGSGRSGGEHCRLPSDRESLSADQTRAQHLVRSRHEAPPDPQWHDIRRVQESFPQPHQELAPPQSYHL